MSYNFKRKTKSKKYLQGREVFKDGKPVWQYWVVYERKETKKKKTFAPVQNNYQYAYPYPND